MMLAFSQVIKAGNLELRHEFELAGDQQVPRPRHRAGLHLHRRQVQRAADPRRRPGLKKANSSFPYLGVKFLRLYWF